VSDFNETGIFVSFEKYSDTKFHENLSRESKVDPHGQTDGWTEKLEAFQNFVNARKN
jgi:hypothetical protein